jgi:hypothetical protein
MRESIRQASEQTKRKDYLQISLNFLRAWMPNRVAIDRSWQAVNIIMEQVALSTMAADSATGMDFTSADNFVPAKWNDWLNLPVRAEEVSALPRTGWRPVRSSCIESTSAGSKLTTGRFRRYLNVGGVQKAV